MQVILKAESGETTVIAAFGRWIAEQAGSPEEAVRRLSKSTLTLTGADVARDILSLDETVATTDGPLDDNQQDAVRITRAVFGVSSAPSRKHCRQHLRHAIHADYRDASIKRLTPLEHQRTTCVGLGERARLLQGHYGSRTD